jgi:hypothetical protein
MLLLLKNGANTTVLAFIDALCRLTTQCCKESTFTIYFHDCNFILLEYVYKWRVSPLFVGQKLSAKH